MEEAAFVLNLRKNQNRLLDWIQENLRISLMAEEVESQQGQWGQLGIKT